MHIIWHFRWNIQIKTISYYTHIITLPTAVWRALLLLDPVYYLLPSTYWAYQNVFINLDNAPWFVSWEVTYIHSAFGSLSILICTTEMVVPISLPCYGINWAGSRMFSMHCDHPNVLSYLGSWRWPNFHNIVFFSRYGLELLQNSKLALAPCHRPLGKNSRAKGLVIKKGIFV